MGYKSLSTKVASVIKKRDVNELKKLIGTDPSIIKDMTPFGSWVHFAISFGGDLEVVKYFVEMGIDVNQKNPISGSNALALAASKGHLEVVEYLLQRGVEMDVSEPERNPLFSAIYGGYKDIVRILIEHGIDTQIDYTGERMTGMDAVAFALERGQTEIAELILSL